MSGYLRKLRLLYSSKKDASGDRPAQQEASIQTAPGTARAGAEAGGDGSSSRSNDVTHSAGSIAQRILNSSTTISKLSASSHHTSASSASSGPKQPQQQHQVLPPPASISTGSTMPPKKAATKRGRGRKNNAGGFFGTNANGGGASATSTAGLEKMFDGLIDEENDSKDTIGVGSSMGYLSSLGVDIESAEIFVVFELVQAPSFGEITRKGFVEGWKATNVGPSLPEQQAYIRACVAQLSTDPAYFKKVYRYTFTAGKEGDQKALDLERAKTFWTMMFSQPGRPWVSQRLDWLDLWKTFLTEKWTRSVNRDMWNQTLEFAVRSMEDESLSFWTEDGAWPSVIDDFVAWYRDAYTGAMELERL